VIVVGSERNPVRKATGYIGSTDNSIIFTNVKDKTERKHLTAYHYVFAWKKRNEKHLPEL